MKAKRNLDRDEVILFAGGYVSKDLAKSDLQKFSLLEHKGKTRILVGPLRFLNHSCKPNCEVRTVIAQQPPVSNQSGTLNPSYIIYPTSQIPNLREVHAMSHARAGL